MYSGTGGFRSKVWHAATCGRVGSMFGSIHSPPVLQIPMECLYLSFGVSSVSTTNGPARCSTDKSYFNPVLLSSCVHSGSGGGDGGGGGGEGGGEGGEGGVFPQTLAASHALNPTLQSVHGFVGPALGSVFPQQ